MLVVLSCLGHLVVAVGWLVVVVGGHGWCWLLVVVGSVMFGGWRCHGWGTWWLHLSLFRSQRFLVVVVGCGGGDGLVVGGCKPEMLVMMGQLLVVVVVVGGGW